MNTDEHGWTRMRRQNDFKIEKIFHVEWKGVHLVLAERTGKTWKEALKRWRAPCNDK